MNPSLLPRVMVATAQQRVLGGVLRTMIDGIAQCADVALTRIWLIGRGDQCEVCQARGAAEDVGPALHLVASAGTARSGLAYDRLDGAFHRFALGERKIGHVAATGEPLLLTGLGEGDAWLADPDWATREGIRTVAAQPLVFRGEVLGVLGLFDRGELHTAASEWLRVFADYAAVSIANARALEEVERLRGRLEQENHYLREEVTAALGMGEFVGQSAALQKVLRQIQLAAPTDASVLIVGESGTGKELVARAIHDRSTRAGRALIKVNCGAVPDSLFESEFFGHVKGAFTGALRDRPGRFELADGGSLFLDEIGELPKPMQAKLLRVLQEGEFERVGDSRTRSVNVRIIAATNRDLMREVDAGRFRQDLYYRLGVFPVTIPPLRERREDIVPLALHFISHSARRLNRPAPRVTRETLEPLIDHPWPGNVRELQNVIERAVIQSQAGPLSLHLETPEASPSRASAPAAPPRLLTRNDLKRLERESIIHALDQADGRVSGPGGAAELLDMKPTTLASRLAALGLGKRR
jgi:transcriptional regulator with GAF, ATPase, and Fis domain